MKVEGKKLAIYYYPGRLTSQIADYIGKHVNGTSQIIEMNDLLNKENESQADASILIFPILGDVRIPDVIERCIGRNKLSKRVEVCVIGDYDKEPISCEVANETIRILAKEGYQTFIPPMLLDSPYINYEKIAPWLDQAINHGKLATWKPQQQDQAMPEIRDPAFDRIIDLLPVMPRYKVNQAGKCMMLSLETCAEYPRSIYDQLTRNELQKLETYINDLHELRELRIPYANIQEWPFKANSFQQIQALDLRGSPMGNYRFLENFKQLVKINIGANDLKEIPLQILELQKLQILFIYKNAIQHVTKEIQNLSQLRWLSMYRNRITTLPRELVNCSKLETLNVGANPIRYLPSFPQVKSLTLRNCQLHTLPINYNEWHSLEQVDLTKNNSLEKAKILQT
ncbi:hypothetical protein BTR23_22020 [Alkalihalophilus pseudofirmus]|nr:hypothetical protein BTR23_22020 [Alkalihalophilus pseudofirmus]